MKNVKTRLHNRMKDDFLNNYLIAYIEKEISKHIRSKDIIDDFAKMKTRRVQLIIRFADEFLYYLQLCIFFSLLVLILILVVCYHRIDRSIIKS